MHVIQRGSHTYMSVYVEEIYNFQDGESYESLVNIYIISQYYSDVPVDMGDEQKAILILADGYTVEEGYDVHKISYVENLQDMEFLNKLLEEIDKILIARRKVENRLIFNSVSIDGIVENYTKYHIFESSLLARHFFEKNTERFYWILNNYTEYINELNRLFEKNKSDLLRYAISYAMYEIDVACKKHSRELPYSPEQIVGNSLELMKKYEDNTQVCLLMADIHFELMDSWAKAANEYGNINLMYCSYAHYKRGRILRKYANDIDNAIISIKNALDLNEDYYNAWYQYAMCYDERDDYEQEIDALRNICIILRVEKGEKFLAPIEREYLYKTILQLQQISMERHFEMDFCDEIGLEEETQQFEYYIKEMNLEENVPEEFIDPDVLKEEFQEKIAEFQMERCI